MATSAGFEPATDGLEIRCSIQLSYEVVESVFSVSSLEWIEELLPIARRDRVATDTVAFGPFALGQMMGAENAVEPGEMDGEVYVDGFAFNAVMPMVEARCYEEAANAL
jgi:hypothetical protein